MKASTVVLTTGTFLRGVINIGERLEGVGVSCESLRTWCRSRQNSSWSYGGGASNRTSQDTGRCQLQTNEIENWQVIIFF